MRSRHKLNFKCVLNISDVTRPMYMITKDPKVVLHCMYMSSFNFGNGMYLKITKKINTSCYILIKNYTAVPTETLHVSHRIFTTCQCKWTSSSTKGTQSYGDMW